jgi:hypothetical protein
MDNGRETVVHVTETVLSVAGLGMTLLLSAVLR